MEYRPCNDGCEFNMISNGVCDYQCFTSSCEYDIPDCYTCNEGCNLSLLLNSGCDAVCNTTACLYDNMSCACAPDCLPNMIGNGNCDPSCNSNSCFYDGGDCTSENSSHIRILTIIGFVIIVVCFILILAVMIWYYRRRRNSNFFRVGSIETSSRNMVNEMNMRFPEDTCSREIIGETCPICMDK